MHVIETIDPSLTNGYTVQVVLDEDGSSCSPREHDNAGTFLGFPHRHYKIGDETLDPHTLTETCGGCGGRGFVTFPLMAELYEHTCSTCEGEGEVRIDVLTYVRREYGARVVLPVGMIDHSGVSYYVGGGAHPCDPGGWDSGTCGVIFDTPDGLATTWGTGDSAPTDEQITAMLTAEIQEYDSWARGDVYGIVVTDHNGDEVESCWGFIGHDYATKDAWKDMLPDAPMPARLHALRLTDQALDAIEAALSMAADDPAFDLAAAALVSVREQRNAD